MRKLFICLLILIACVHISFAQGKITRPHHAIQSPNSSGSINGHSYVDLGLPSGTKWATCNIGANNPWEFGDYFAWGEASTKRNYTKENCLTMNKSIIIGSEREYNTAMLNWGNQWSIPEREQIIELIEKCNWEWYNFNGNYGYKVIGPNKNSIFIPCAGGFNGTDNRGKNKMGAYWGYYYADSFELATDNYTSALCFCFDEAHNPETINRSRWYGFSVRPVAK